MKALNDQIEEIENVLNRILDDIALSICSTTCSNSVELRWQIGYLRANFAALLVDGKFAADFQKCFTEMYEANAKFETVMRILQHLFLEDPIQEVPLAIVESAICYCLATQSALIAKIDFESRDDVEVMMAKMKWAFDTAKEMAADNHSNNAYEQISRLSGAVTQHLYATARPLPRIVNFKLGKPFPALYSSQRVYYDASRWEEIVKENKIVHPLFVPRIFRGLSA